MSQPFVRAQILAAILFNQNPFRGIAFAVKYGSEKCQNSKKYQFLQF